jgi:hypothetical protein
MLLLLIRWLLKETTIARSLPAGGCSRRHSCRTSSAHVHDRDALYSLGDRQSWPPRSANGLLHRTFCRRPEQRVSDGSPGRVRCSLGLLGILTFQDQSPLIARSRWLLRGIIGSLSHRLPRLQQRPVSQNTNLTVGSGLVRRRACRNLFSTNLTPH